MLVEELGEGLEEGLLEATAVPVPIEVELPPETGVGEVTGSELVDLKKFG